MAALRKDRERTVVEIHKIDHQLEEIDTLAQSQLQDVNTIQTQIQAKNNQIQKNKVSIYPI